MLNENHELSDAWFDRLVDGELSADEERRLLETLDRRPELWRRCALAFLESRAWHLACRPRRAEMMDARPASAGVPADSMPLASKSAQPRAVPSKDVQPKTSPDSASRPIIPWALLAASLVVALGLGAASERWRHQRNIDGMDATTGASRELPTDSDATMPTSPSPVGDVTLVDSRGESFQVPVYPWAGGQLPTGNRETMIPAEELQRVVHELGHRLQRRQRVVPVELEDGRRVLVPAEQWELVPVGGTSFQ